MPDDLFKPPTSNLQPITRKMLSHRIYYLLKPFTPRWVQLGLRRRIASRKRALCANLWPIEKKIKRPPDGWSGWPEKKRFALVLTHDVEAERGQDKCIQLSRLEESQGFRSSFNFVAEDCEVSVGLLNYLSSHRFEIGVHGLHHDGNLFESKKKFGEQAIRINYYLKEWGSVGFRAPCMYHNLDWMQDLNIEYDSSTFDTDPFEPQPDGMSTIFPFWVPRNSKSLSFNLEPFSFGLSPSSSNPQPPTFNEELATRNPELVTSNLKPPTASANGYVELPYTLPQDFTLFILMKEKNIDIWKKKLDWIAEKGGMALIITHPDYMNFDGKRLTVEEYPAKYYEEFLKYIKCKYENQYWHVLPRDMARYWSKIMPTKCIDRNSETNQSL